MSFVFGSFVFPVFLNWALGKGAPGAEKIGKFGRNPPKYGGFQGGLAKFKRPVTFRSAPWGSAVCLFICGSFVFPAFLNWVLGKGAPGAKNIGEFWEGSAEI